MIIMYCFLCLRPSISEPADAPPKTFTTKDKFEYFKPCVQVEMDNPDKPDTVTEFFVRGKVTTKVHFSTRQQLVIDIFYCSPILMQGQCSIERSPMLQALIILT